MAEVFRAKKSEAGESVDCDRGVCRSARGGGEPPGADAGGHTDPDNHTVRRGARRDPPGRVVSYDAGEPADPGKRDEGAATAIGEALYVRHGWSWVEGELGHLRRRSHLPGRVGRYRALAAELRGQGWSNVEIGRVFGRRADTILRLLVGAAP
jgi:hypothetical protein